MIVTEDTQHYLLNINSNAILDQAQQPYNYLIESIRQRDNQILKQKDYTSTLEYDVK
jgi:progesterone-induced-blocking factor 1